MRYRASLLRYPIVLMVCVVALAALAVVFARSTWAARPAAAAVPDVDLQLLADGTEEMYSLARIEPSATAGVLPPTTSPPATSPPATSPPATSPPAAGAPGGAPVVRAVIQTRVKFADRWKVVARLDSRPLAMTQRAGDVAVLLDDGAWMLLWPGGGSVGPAAPYGTKMITLGSDGDSRLFALIAGDLSHLPTETRKSSTTSSTSPNTSSTTASTAPLASAAASSPPIPSTAAAPTSATNAAPASAPSAASQSLSAVTDSTRSLGLFELIGSQWSLRARISSEFVADNAQDVSLAAVAGKPTLAIREARDGHIHILQFANDAKGGAILAAHDLGSLGCAPSFKLLASTARPMVWIASGGAAGSIAFLDEIATLHELDDSPGLTERSAKSIAIAAGSLRMVFARAGGAAGSVVEQTYSFDGKLKGVSLPIALADSSATHGMYEWLTFPVLVVLTLLLLGPARRRPGEPIVIGGTRFTAAADPSLDDRSIDDGSDDAVQRPRRLPRSDGIPADAQEHVIAPMTSRMLAVFVDALPVVVVLVWAAVDVQGVGADDKPSTLSSWLILLLVSLAIYFVHTLVSELIWGRTLGKWLFGLRVVTTEGERPAALPILIRSLLRIVEVALVVPVLIVTLTPLQQRAGDFAAGTVVVLDSPAAAASHDD